MNLVEKILLNNLTSLKEAMQIIDTGQMKIALVIDKDKRLIGTLSDGDVRRAILKGVDLSSPVETIMNYDFVYAKVGDSKDKILRIAQLNKIYQIPIVDENFLLVGIEEISELFGGHTYSNKIVLMVGGLGTRLRPLTEKIPKPLLKVGGKPILEIIVESFAKYGFKNFIFSVNYKSEMIEEYFGDGSKIGVNIQYVKENKKMGTAGSLSLLKDEFIDDFFIMNGDLLTDINFEHLMNFHKNGNSEATMCVREYDFEVPYGVVNVENDNIVSIIEKPSYEFFVNAGIYVLNPAVLKYIPEDSFFDMPNLFDMLIKDNRKTLSFPIRDYWLDIGGIDEYKKANDEYSNNFNN
jgi:dTDP-glucose pyrophosphorylase